MKTISIDTVDNGWVVTTCKLLTTEKYVFNTMIPMLQFVAEQTAIRDDEFTIGSRIAINNFK